MATADHEATGGSDAVRVSVDAENATAIEQHESGKLHTGPDRSAGKSCCGADPAIKASIMPSFTIKKLYRFSPALHQILHCYSAI